MSLSSLSPRSRLNRQELMVNRITLKGITWDHSRGFTSVVATAQRFHELHPELDVQWHKRSLQEFADKPLEQLAGEYDLLVIDHPWAGFAASSGILVDLAELLSPDFLSDQAKHSVGQSHSSYNFDGKQWGLAIDAACPVSAYRPDLLDVHGVAVPQTFDELIALAERGLVCCPSIALDTYGNFLNLLMAAGEEIFPNQQEVADREAALTALRRLKELSDRIPDRFFDLNPIRTLEVMSQTDDFAYAPYTYGYANYSRVGYAARRLAFGDVIGIEPDQPGATMLGGAGLAISNRCEHMDVAKAYAEFTGSPRVQNGVYFYAGGQPGHRSAWTNPTLDEQSDGFFSRTLPTLDRAFVRPRYAGYLQFQDTACLHIHDYLRCGGNVEQTLDTVNQIYRETRQ
ncbi:MAG: ABC transporter substrate-binding protein [Rhodopirellula sp. JB044]|uniref:ABC transporter substrate-binding protein n=1 Tax=Rhodopirellula sp. JB044 TaxID=3342844 RepID=UPI00370A0657